jgi:hypothetical protein
VDACFCAVFGGPGGSWLVDPVATTLEVYRLDSEGWRLVSTYAGDAKVRPEPFHAVELELGGLWGR